jgi:hypothetical protein
VDIDRCCGDHLTKELGPGQPVAQKRLPIRTGSRRWKEFPLTNVRITTTTSVTH